jgi:glutathionyl-hydroquinone reductase
MNKGYTDVMKKTNLKNALGLICGVLFLISFVVLDYTYDKKYGEPIEQMQKQIQWLNEQYTPIHNLEEKVDFNYHIIGDHYQECQRQINDGDLEPISCHASLEEFLAERKTELINRPD